MPALSTEAHYSISHKAWWFVVVRGKDPVLVSPAAYPTRAAAEYAATASIRSLERVALRHVQA